MLKRAGRILFFIATATLIGGCSDSSGSTGPLPLLKHDPILFVHGYGGNNGNWEEMENRFRADGWQEVELYAYNYSFINSNAASAAEISSQVDNIIAKTGATKVDIIAFSIGSVSSRYYLKNLGGAGKVDAWVSLAGPNHGTTAGEDAGCNFTPCKEIAPGSAFLTALNAIDETPGLVRYATWRSLCDATINPTESVVLSGATNNQTACIPHIALLTDAPTYRQVRDFVQ